MTLLSIEKRNSFNVDVREQSKPHPPPLSFHPLPHNYRSNLETRNAALNRSSESTHSLFLSRERPNPFFKIIIAFFILLSLSPILSSRPLFRFLSSFPLLLSPSAHSAFVFPPSLLPLLLRQRSPGGKHPYSCRIRCN